MGQTLKRVYFLCSLQHFGGNQNTRDLKAQGPVEYQKNKVPMKKVAHFYFWVIFDRKCIKYVISVIYHFLKLTFVYKL